MTSIRSSLPPLAPPPSRADAPAPSHVPIAQDGGIEGIILELEEQSRRARELRNDARDARRDQQARGIEDKREGANLALAGNLVALVGQTAGSLAGSASSSGGEGGGSAGGGADAATGTGAVPTGASAEANMPLGDASASPAPDPSAARRGAGQLAAGVGEVGGVVLNHLATRAETRAEVSAHAAETYADVAEDAAQAQQDATRMSERALQHLDAILTARREAVAAILRG